MLIAIHFISSLFVLYKDVTERVINNELVIIILALSVINSGVTNFTAWYLICIAIGLALFTTGIFAGGDIKLMLAYLIGIDSQWWPVVFLLTALMGGVMALGYLAYGALCNKMRQVRERGLPYGVPIALSGFLGVWLTSLAH